MAFVTKTLNDARPVGRKGLRPRVLRSLVPGVFIAAAGIGACAALMAGFSTMHTIAMAFPSRADFRQEVRLAPNAIALVASQERLDRFPKYPRLPLLAKHEQNTEELTADVLISADGSVTITPRPVVVAAHTPLTVDAFVSRASGIALADAATSPGKDVLFDAPPIMTEALAQDVLSPANGAIQQPFSLVLADAEPSSDEDSAPTIPLPGVRPRRQVESVAAPSGGGRANRRSGEMLAYARPDGAIDEDAPTYRTSTPLPGARSGVAIYDIEARTVYLPNGERLEAHSGLGSMLDKPRYANQKNRGPTPPNTYDLSMRESLFHGVAALRLNPVDARRVYGRDGLLAHTYMLGSRGDSNGCVSFKDYRRFLAAFKRGEIKRLVVVPRLSAPPVRVASN